MTKHEHQRNEAPGIITKKKQKQIVTTDEEADERKSDQNRIAGKRPDRGTEPRQRQREGKGREKGGKGYRF